MSVHTSCTTALPALVMDRQPSRSAQYVASIAVRGCTDRRNTASAPLIPTRSFHPPPTITTSSRLHGFCHPLRRRQIAIGRGGISLPQLPAGSFPGRFRTTAPVPVARSRSAVVRNPSQLRTWLAPHDRMKRGSCNAGRLNLVAFNFRVCLPAPFSRFQREIHLAFRSRPTGFADFAASWNAWCPRIRC